MRPTFRWLPCFGISSDRVAFAISLEEARDAVNRIGQIDALISAGWAID
jgi:hypothetical protein